MSVARGELQRGPAVVDHVGPVSKRNRELGALFDDEDRGALDEAEMQAAGR